MTLSGASRSWPWVEGRIERSETFLKLSPYRHDRGRTGYYVPRILVAYQVSGRSYTSDVISYGKEPIYTSLRATAQAKCNQYPVGKTTRLYFDPGAPAQACLERGTGSLLLGYLLAILIAVLGVLALAGVVLC